MMHCSEGAKSAKGELSTLKRFHFRDVWSASASGTGALVIVMPINMMALVSACVCARLRVSMHVSLVGCIRLCFTCARTDRDSRTACLSP